MKDPRTLLADFRARVVIAPALAAREDWLGRIDALAKALEAQAAQIAHSIEDVLQPRGVAVVIEAAHECMTTRGIHKRGVSMVTSAMLGAFRDDGRTRAEFLQFIGMGGASR